MRKIVLNEIGELQIASNIIGVKVSKPHYRWYSRSNVESGVRENSGVTPLSLP